MVIPQIFLVPVTYLLAQMIEMMGAWYAWGSVASGQTFNMRDVIQAALAYDRWTPFSFSVVKMTIICIIVVDLLAMVSHGIQKVFLVLIVPSLGAAALVAFAGLFVLLDALTGVDGYTFEMVWFYVIWIVSLVLWSYLLAMTCTKPTDFKYRLRAAKSRQWVTMLVRHRACDSLEFRGAGVEVDQESCS